MLAFWQAVKIPELIDEILSLVSTKDAKAFAYAARVNGALARRLDPVRYLSRGFGGERQARELLRAMAKHGVVLSGSRALEYWFPGSATNASDWDFYLPKEINSACGFMQAAENAGIFWVSPEDTMGEVIATERARGKDVLTLPVELIFRIQYRHWPEGSVTARIKDLIGRYEVRNDVDLNIRSAEPRHWFIQLRKKANSVPPDETDIGSLYPHIRFNVRIGINDSNETVQLIWCREGRWQALARTFDSRPTACASLYQTLPMILQFHSSHVQAIITGVAAAHLYYSSSNKGRSWIWQGSFRNDPRADLALEKHATRGWEFDAAPDRAQVRRLGDCNSGGRVESFDCSTWDDGATFRRIQDHENYVLRSFTWSEVSGFLKPTKGLAELLADRWNTIDLLLNVPADSLFITELPLPNSPNHHCLTQGSVRYAHPHVCSIATQIAQDNLGDRRKDQLSYLKRSSLSTPDVQDLVWNSISSCAIRHWGAQQLKKASRASFVPADIPGWEWVCFVCKARV